MYRTILPSNVYRPELSTYYGVTNGLLKWSSHDHFAFVFLAIMCPSLPSPSNGLKTGCANPLSEPYGTVCSFSCNTGYNLTGSPRRKCLENKKWSGLTSFCHG